MPVDIVETMKARRITLWMPTVGSPSLPSLYMVDEECLAAAAEIERLRGALVDAICEVESWAGYASDYFRHKHDLNATVTRLQAFLLPGAETKTPG